MQKKQFIVQQQRNDNVGQVLLIAPDLLYFQRHHRPPTFTSKAFYISHTLDVVFICKQVARKEVNFKRNEHQHENYKRCRLNEVLGEKRNKLFPMKFSEMNFSEKILLLSAISLFMRCCRTFLHSS